jgi:hypothetical protein
MKVVAETSIALSCPYACQEGKERSGVIAPLIHNLVA